MYVKPRSYGLHLQNSEYPSLTLALLIRHLLIGSRHAEVAVFAIECKTCSSSPKLAVSKLRLYMKHDVNSVAINININTQS
eukprot:4220635-Amphidinium_carterae.1